MRDSQLPYGELHQLKRWNTPTIYNGWEQITSADHARDGFNLEPVIDFMPQMGPMVGYAITATTEASNPEHPKRNPNGWTEYREYVASVPGPKIVVVQDLDKPRMIGAWWGECNASTHRALGCVGSICDGAIRDVDEMIDVGFKVLARGMCVGHAHSWPVEWDCEVEVFGRAVKPGQLIHADKHGFLVIPKEDEAKLLDAALFMDRAECTAFIPTVRNVAGKSTREILDGISDGLTAFRKMVGDKFGRKGEW